MSDQAPFIGPRPDEPAIESSTFGVLRGKFFRLFVAQFSSSLGDWTAGLAVDREKALGEIRAMSRLVQDLLSFSKAGLRTEPVAVRPVALASLGSFT